MSIPSTVKAGLPFTLLLDPETGRAAAYTFSHRLITDSASEKLVQFVLENVSQEKPFSRAEHEVQAHRRPLPAWVTEDIQDRLRLIWIKRPDGESPDADWLAIPAR